MKMDAAGDDDSKNASFFTMIQSCNYAVAYKFPHIVLFIAILVYLCFRLLSIPLFIAICLTVSKVNFTLRLPCVFYTQTGQCFLHSDWLVFFTLRLARVFTLRLAHVFYTQTASCFLHSDWLVFFTLRLAHVFYTQTALCFLHSDWLVFFTLRLARVFLHILLYIVIIIILLFIFL